MSLKSIHINESTKQKLTQLAKQRDTSTSAIIRAGVAAIASQKDERQHDRRIQMKVRIDDARWQDALDAVDGTGVSMSEALREYLDDYVKGRTNG